MANRILVALSGLALLAGGGLIFVGGLDLYRRWHLTPPDGWPLITPQAVVFSASDRSRWTNEGWWWPAVIASLTVIVLLALWWLWAQLRGVHPGGMRVGGASPTEGVELRDHALADAIAADAHHLPGVHHAKVEMTGRAHHPKARIALTLSPDCEPGAVLQALSHGPLERARQSTGWGQLPTQVRLQITSHKPRRAD
ncbi:MULTISPECIES: alkaline shock response membrane anchor protein AmaP [Streptomyces]|uniref:alkaline shock response membrane anchor protein AmaP n=1 Tax=Streptomyces TaxID=1883 RepID=UPI0022AEF560|nr:MULTISPECIES: alkaline shock response membrane anchor protein AmaP [Streptomyces]MCZ4102223.1 alkaline shock response membrane anchor protein AmaP [Streptomyces sp. H39-C1]